MEPAELNTSYSFFRLIANQNLYPVFGFSFTDYKLNEADESGIEFWNFSVGFSNILFTRNRFQIKSFIKTGFFYGEYYFMGRGINKAQVNPLAQIGFDLQYLLFYNYNVHLTLGPTLEARFIGDPTVLFSWTGNVGVIFQFDGISSAPKSKGETLRSNIKNHYENSEFEKAERDIQSLEKLDPNDIMIDRYKNLIRQKRKFLQAISLEKDDQYRALQILQSLHDLPEAQENAHRIKESLKGNIPTLEEKGISAYNAQKYKEATVYFNKILIIEPDNHTAKAYLLRARNRQKAIEQLK